MSNYKSEARLEQLKSFAAIMFVLALAVFLVALNPRTKALLGAAPHAALGGVAPEIIGVDADSKPMKLSDYRGKIVMLDFFGNW
jgi:hypothetical protein